ncbi:hypothetical protein V144x_36360 [Gimesia aquarii]|uniref:Uncharacterized protein n=2 Tax=Gimesia aquarii TaxID=2527964 RepID=A0A517VYS4_9PLAN|nr:hypothetical protein V144x_36360 [Gimesia aquarii]
MYWSKSHPNSDLMTGDNEPGLQQSIHRFLNSEGESIATDMEQSFTSYNSNLEHEYHNKFIPLNVVPERTGTQKQKSHSEKVHSAKKIIFSPKKRRDSAQLKKHLRQTENRANDLVRQSTNSFTRGLMPLVDYNLALKIAFDTKIEVAEIQKTKQNKGFLLEQKQQLIQQAVEQLQEFDQPASQGWYGDLVHAKLLLAQNQYEIARVNQDRDAQQFALEAISKNSAEYYAIRNIEAQVGEADLSEYRRALSSVNNANQELDLFYQNTKNDTASFETYERRLEEIKTDINWMASNGAGLGRADLLDLSKAHLSYAKGKYSLNNNRKGRSQELFTESMQYAKAAWNLRANQYYPAGTASLHDVTSSWLMWKAAGTELADLKTTDSQSIDKELNVGLDQMLNLADSIRDRRGRLDSDVSLVHCLKNSEKLSDYKRKLSD